MDNRGADTGGGGRELTGQFYFFDFARAFKSSKLMLLRSEPRLVAPHKFVITFPGWVR